MSGIALIVLRPPTDFGNHRTLTRSDSGRQHRVVRMCLPGGAVLGKILPHQDSHPIRDYCLAARAVSFIVLAARCSCGLATVTPQTFTMAYPDAGFTGPEGFPSSRNHHKNAPLPAHIHQIRPGITLGGFTTLVPRVLLSITLTGPTPSGSADAPRLCPGCSHPPRQLPDQAALSSTGPLRRPRDAGPSPPLEQQRLTAHETSVERIRSHLRRPDRSDHHQLMTKIIYTENLTLPLTLACLSVCGYILEVRFD